MSWKFHCCGLPSKLKLTVTLPSASRNRRCSQTAPLGGLLCSAGLAFTNSAERCQTNISLQVQLNYCCFFCRHKAENTHLATANVHFNNEQNIPNHLGITVSDLSRANKWIVRHKFSSSGAETGGASKDYDCVIVVTVSVCVCMCWPQGTINLQRNRLWLSTSSSAASPTQ